MTLAAYKTRARYREAAWCPDPWTAIREDGSAADLAEAGVMHYADTDAAVDWFNHRIGSLIRWNDRRIQWVSPESVKVRLLKDSPDDDEAAAGLFAWAEWARAEGAGIGSMGATGISLIRATLDKRDRIVAWRRGVPAFVPVGGRIGGHLRPGPWRGDAVQIDLPAAYASELGGLTWEGEFRPRSDGASAQDAPSMIEATISVPDYLPDGPVPLRPATAATTPDRIFAPLDEVETYPVGETVTGIWTREEIDLARELGCDILESRTWAMPSNAAVKPFAAWWRAIERGRSMDGWAGLLAKQTGNATVGALCPHPGGVLSREWWEGRRKMIACAECDGPLTVGDHAHRSPSRHHLLYETVAGRVRARLGRVLAYFGTDALYWHTDGAWVTTEALAFPGPAQAAEGWRVKQRATAIDYLNPATYAYTDGGIATTYVISGEPKATGALAFDREWMHMLDDPGRRLRATPHPHYHERRKAS